MTEMKRIAVVRDGLDDHAVEFKIPRFGTVGDAIAYLGEEHSIRILESYITTEARKMAVRSFRHSHP